MSFGLSGIENKRPVQVSKLRRLAGPIYGFVDALERLWVFPGWAPWRVASRLDCFVTAFLAKTEFGEFGNFAHRIYDLRHGRSSRTLVFASAATRSRLGSKKQEGFATAFLANTKLGVFAHHIYGLRHGRSLRALVFASAATRSRLGSGKLDSFVATLLAMTRKI